MAQISVGDIPNRSGHFQEQRPARGHVPDYHTPGFPILPQVYPKDRVQETVRTSAKPFAERRQVLLPNACHQPQRSRYPSTPP